MQCVGSKTLVSVASSTLRSCEEYAHPPAALLGAEQWQPAFGIGGRSLGNAAHALPRSPARKELGGRDGRNSGRASVYGSVQVGNQVRPATATQTETADFAGIVQAGSGANATVIQKGHYNACEPTLPAAARFASGR